MIWGRWRFMVRRLTLRTLALIGFIVSITALLFGAVSIWGARQEVVLPTPSGLLPVGRAVLEWRDDSRNDPISPDKATRSLLIWLWYPAIAPPHSPPAPYVPESWAKELDRANGYLEHRLERIQSHAVADAPVSPAASQYPVLVFSPGYGSQPTDYTTIAEDLAS